MTDTKHDPVTDKVCEQCGRTHDQQVSYWHVRFSQLFQAWLCRGCWQQRFDQELDKLEAERDSYGR